ncbi:rhodanese-like domain-containing protein [archaeon]|jgi:rhodanese-related sulfurtransferase|nr:rhodanese-like domain-containing protein [archaeon]MBT4241703.1 rhodanese-like domain-containing protein [archaeon]MBT4418251.1 rhodanese-like domain-containing protein [archaeon]
MDNNDNKNILSISVKDAEALIKDNENSKDFIILDVRTSEEYEEGHLKGAIKLDMGSSDFDEVLGKLDKNFKYLIYCRTDARSSEVLELMNKQGFVNVYNMNGGILEWIEKGLEIEK